MNNMTLKLKTLRSSRTLLIIWGILASLGSSLHVQDLSPMDCGLFDYDGAAKPTDHLMISFSVYKDGMLEKKLGISGPDPLMHLVLDSEGTSVHDALVGMCRNTSRMLTWSIGDGTPVLDVLTPLVDEDGVKLITPAQNISIVLTTHHITTPEDFAIFDALDRNDLPTVMDFVSDNERKGVFRGINAVNEHGTSAFMVACRRPVMQVVAAFLNARRPRLDVNFAKPSGHSALHYSIEAPTIDVTQALLRRGADPNKAITSPNLDLDGMTVLHFACKGEKLKHTRTLLSFGADPHAKSTKGLSPLEVLPRDSTSRTHFGKVFREAELANGNERSSKKEL